MKLSQAVHAACRTNSEVLPALLIVMVASRPNGYMLRDSVIAAAVRNAGVEPEAVMFALSQLANERPNALDIKVQRNRVGVHLNGGQASSIAHHKIGWAWSVLSAVDTEWATAVWNRRRANALFRHNG